MSIEGDISMADLIILNKTASIERCLNRIREDFEGFEDQFLKDQMRQDAIFLNLQRACELSIDLANHLVKVLQLGIPQDSRSCFDLLEKDNFIPADLSLNLKRMVSFRNIAVHQYQEIDLALAQEIVSKHLGVFKDLIKIVLTSQA